MAKKNSGQQPLLGLSATGTRLIWGDCVQVMRGLEEASVDAVVCDPPYGLKFMGKDFDKLGDGPGQQAWHQAWAVEALRVLKPGGHLIAFGGTRTYHRMACAVEDAGFEMRDSLMYVYGAGFPKSLDVSKALDKMAGAEREVVGRSDHHVSGKENQRTEGLCGSSTFQETVGMGAFVTAPATPEAQAWEGYGTALKPSYEPAIHAVKPGAAEDRGVAYDAAVLARKPLQGTVARNVLAHGVGALNIDGCRVGTEGGGTHCTNRGPNGQCLGHKNAGQSTSGETFHGPDTEGGRWPPNVLTDGSDAVVAGFPDCDGASSNGRKGNPHVNCYGDYGAQAQVPGRNDSGSAARFFPAFPITPADACFYYTSKAGGADRAYGNTHPTVKPVDLMRWLVRLVTRKGGLVLDPFCGSGSTGLACGAEGLRFIGIERERAYAEIAQRRLMLTEIEVGPGGSE
jgi:site-specific DNA-methyltransferase (adenine-specific)